MRTSTDVPRLHLIRSLLGAVALGAAFLACASVDAAAQTGAAEGPKVTVLIYSGRPNPSFTLSASQAQELQKLIAAARQDPSFQGRSALPSILGYNGIVVVWSSGNSRAVYRNHIEVREQGAPRFLADGGETEEFLLNAAVESKALDAEQLRFIRGNRPDTTP
jgi:hypothetical protein